MFTHICIYTYTHTDAGWCELGAESQCGRGKCVAVGEGGAHGSEVGERGDGGDRGGEEGGEDAMRGGVGGICECEADIIGARCEHSLLEDVKYLPRHDPLLQGHSLGVCQVFFFWIHVCMDNTPHDMRCLSRNDSLL